MNQQATTSHSTLEIIPAIDLIDAKCVRLSQGDYAKKVVYNEDPLEVAKEFENHGIRRLHLVDLDGAKAGHIINHPTLERIASKTSLTIDFGGGLKSEQDLRIAFESGAAMVTGGSIAVKHPSAFESWVTRYGNEKIILGVDAKDGHIAVTRRGSPCACPRRDRAASTGPRRAIPDSRPSRRRPPIPPPSPAGPNRPPKSCFLSSDDTTQKGSAK